MQLLGISSKPPGRFLMNKQCMMNEIKKLMLRKVTIDNAEMKRTFLITTNAILLTVRLCNPSHLFLRQQ